LFAWAALQFGITGAALAGLVFSVVAAWSTATGHGTFALPHSHLSLVLLWTYMASTVITGLLITAMQAERRAIEQRFSDLVGSTDGIVWEADAITFGFVFVSQNAERMLGYPTADWLQPGFWAQHIHPEDRDHTVQYCAACTGRLENHDFEYRFIAADGRVVWLRDIVRVVTENGHPRWLRGLMIDITLQKQAQLALQTSLREKNALLLEVHHRVKNNLQVITSLLRLERFRSTDAPTKSVLQDMQSRIRAMALLHEAIYRKGTFAAIDLGSYIGQIAGESVKTLSTTPGAVQLCLDVGECKSAWTRPRPVAC
jgi:PAS domain S-box-containing protein